jgi:hypothetical protein
MASDLVRVAGKYLTTHAQDRPFLRVAGNFFATHQQPGQANSNFTVQMA